MFFLGQLCFIATLIPYVILHFVLSSLCRWITEFIFNLLFAKFYNLICSIHFSWTSRFYGINYKNNLLQFEILHNNLSRLTNLDATSWKDLDRRLDIKKACFFLNKRKILFLDSAIWTFHKLLSYSLDI